MLTWTAIRALTVYSKIDAVRRSAMMLLSLLIAQLYLGFTAFLTRVAWGKEALQPELPMVISTVAHVAVGALLLATTVILAIQVWRQVPVAFEERVPGTERTPQAACTHAPNTPHAKGEWIGAEVTLQTPLLAQYAVSHYLEQARVLDADVVE